MAKRLFLFLVVVVGLTEALCACGGQKKENLTFEDVTVSCEKEEGWFGARSAALTVKGSVTNNTGENVTADDMPSMKADGDEPSSTKPKLTVEELGAGKTCDFTYEKDFDMNQSLPQLSFEGELSFEGLDEAEEKANEGVGKVKQDFDDDDAARDQKKEEERKAAEEKRKAAEKEKEDTQKTIESCVDKTADEAMDAAKKAGYSFTFKDVNGVDVTSDVKDSENGSDVHQAVVKEVEVKEGWLGSMSATFTLDYVDQASAEKEDAKKAVEGSEGKTADEAMGAAKKAEYGFEFKDSNGVDVTSDVEDSGNGSAVHKAVVKEVEVKKGLFGPVTATFTLDYVDQAAAEEAASRKKANDVLNNAVGKTAEEVIGALESLGKDYIVRDPNGDIISHVTDPDYAGARSRAIVTEAKDINYRKPKITLDRTLAITREDSAEFAEFLDVQSEFDERIGRFVQGHIGMNIEFDGHVAYVMPYPDKKTRFDLLLIAGDADAVDGPQFKFEDINLIHDIKWSGQRPEYVTDGLNLHIVARIDKWTGDSALVLLTPVQTSLR